MNSNSNPLVSVIITTKNRKRIVQRAIESVINQTYKNIEIIVVDDGSSDGTSEFLLHNYPNLKIITNRSSMGACFARNVGIDASNGEYISGLDDDEYHPERISQLLAALKNSSYSFSCCHAVNMNVSGTVINEKLKPEIIDSNQLLKANYVGSQVLVEKEKIISIGGFDEALVASQDHDMWLRLSLKYGNAIKIKGYYYVCHIDNNIERVSKHKLKGLFQFYSKHSSYMTIPQKIYNILRMNKMLLQSFFG